MVTHSSRAGSLAIGKDCCNVVLKYGPTNLTKGALWYHSNKVRPRWSYAYVPIRVIEDHIFMLNFRDDLSIRKIVFGK